MGPLDSYLPYLLNRAGARIATAFGEEVRPLGATLQMWRVLAALREQDGRRMGDLGDMTSIEGSVLPPPAWSMAWRRRGWGRAAAPLMMRGSLRFTPRRRGGGSPAASSLSPNA